MIYDSMAWKKELARQMRRIKLFNKKLLFNAAFDFTYSTIEKSIMFSAFAIRKLIDSKKTTDLVDNYIIQVKAFSPIQDITRLNNVYLLDNYDFSASNSINVKGRDICNNLIHSYVWQLEFDEKRKADGFYIASDFNRNKCLYSIEIKSWLEYINLTIADYITHKEYHYDEKKQDYIVIKKA